MPYKEAEEEGRGEGEKERRRRGEGEEKEKRERRGAGQGEGTAQPVQGWRMVNAGTGGGPRQKSIHVVHIESQMSAKWFHDLYIHHQSTHLSSRSTTISQVQQNPQGKNRKDHQ